MNRHFRPLLALIWKDAKVFFVDRQAIVMSLVIPVLIAAILGWLDSSSTDSQAPPKISVLFVDQDGSDVSVALRQALEKSGKLTLKSVARHVAEQRVREGQNPVAIVLPKGFSTRAKTALSEGPQAELTILKDPSDPLTSEIVEQAVYEQASRAAAKQVFGALADRESPVKINDVSVASGQAPWAKSAHDFSGFCLQGLLFFAVEAAVVLAKERRSGVWSRLRSSPVPAKVILASRAISSSALALAIILLMFTVGALLFGIRVRGSVPAFLALSVAAAVMSASFGLMISTLGKTETQSRALSILIIFVMLATGGAWFPLEKMPPAVQLGASYLPVRWAVEGFDGVTWRGLAFSDSARTILVLLGFTVIFSFASLWRFTKYQSD